MDPFQQYYSLLQNQTPPTSDNSQYPQHPRFPPQPPYYFTNQPPHTGDNSQNPPYPIFSSPPPYYFPNQPPHYSQYSQIGGSSSHVPETQIEPTLASEEPEFSTQLSLDNITLEEEESPTGTNLRKKKKKKAMTTTAKRVAWSIEEDTHLIRSWANVGKDSIVGNDQKSDLYWGRIAAGYNEHRRTGLASRCPQSVKSRYMKLNAQCQAFTGCYNEAKNRRKSGYSENDIMAEAFAFYATSKGGDFKSEHAWRLLKDEPKWLGECMPIHSKRQKHSSDGAYTSSSNPNTPIDCSEYEHAQPPVRPICQEQAKRNAKTKAAKASPTYMDLSNLEAGVDSVRNL